MLEIMKTTMSNIQILEAGVCKCTYEPRGDAGLESYMRNKLYNYQLCQKNDKKYYRVFPGSEMHFDKTPTPNQQFSVDPDYYETTGRNLFYRYFEKL